MRPIGQIRKCKFNKLSRALKFLKITSKLVPVKMFYEPEHRFEKFGK